jgi:2-amino-4-hydroxy-6-hydroxymethyldihydropteridine diphosphokinase
MPLAYLGLGSNEGDRLRHLRSAVERLQEHEALQVVAASPVYETEAHTLSSGDEQPPFLNAVLETETERSPGALLRHAQAVEKAEGRTRSGKKWAPRPLDIDLLAVDGITRQTSTLTLPHPRLAERRFVLRPWADLAPNFVVPPPFDRTVQALLEQCPDAAAIRQTDDRIDQAVSGRAAGRDSE